MNLSFVLQCAKRVVQRLLGHARLFEGLRFKSLSGWVLLMTWVFGARNLQLYAKDDES